MAEMPTVGLQVDLNEIVNAKAQYSALQDAIAGVGATAQDTADKIQAALEREQMFIIQLTKQQTAIAAAEYDATRQAFDDDSAARMVQAQREQLFIIQLAKGEVAARDDALAASAAAQTAYYQGVAADAAAAGAAQVAISRAVAADVAAAGRAQVALSREMAADAATAARAQIAAENEVVAAGLYSMKLRQQYQKELDADAATAAAAQIAIQQAATADAATAAAAQSALEKEVADATLVGAAEQIAAHKAVGVSALQIREPIVILREAMRGDDSRMAGSVTLLAQAFGFLTPEILGIGAIIVAITAPFVALATATALVVTDQANFADAMRETNGILGLTYTQFQNLTQEIATNTHQALGVVQKDFLAAAASGEFNAQTLVLMASNAQAFGDLTHTAADKVVADFERMADGPTKWAEAFDKQHHAFTEAQIEEIQQLEQRGDVEGAEFKTQQDIYNWLGTQGPAQLSFLESVWRDVTNTIDGATQALKNFSVVQTPKQQIANLQSKIASAENSQDDFGFSTDQSRANIDAWQKQLTALQQAEAQQEAMAAATAKTTEVQAKGVQALQDIQDHYKSISGNAQLAANAVKAYEADIANLRAANPNSPDLPTSKEQVEQEALIRKKYDRVGNVKTPSMAGAINSIAVMQAAVDGLQKELDTVSADPLADMAAKIQKAGEQAAAQRTAGKGNAFQDQAQQLAEQKELLTLTLQMADALAKQTRAAQDARDATDTAIDQEVQRYTILNGVYTDGALNVNTYEAALQQVNANQLDAADAQARLTVAQQYGVTSVDQISAAIVAHAQATGTLTTKTQAAADAVQKLAQADADAKAALAVDTIEKARQTELDNQILGASSLLQQTKDEADAYTRGAAALADYNRNLAIKKAIDASGGQLTVQDAAAQVDAQTLATTHLLEAQSDLTRQVQEGSAAREAETLSTQILAGYMAQAAQSGQTLTEADKQRLTTQAQIEAQMRQQIIDSQKLEEAIQDSIRDAFIKTGNLDFSSLKKAVEEQLNKAIYDAFLAKPIDIIVNAAVQWEQNALNSLFSSGSGGSIGGQAGEILSSLGLNGGGSSGGLGSIFSSFGSSLSSLASSISSFAGPAAAIVAVDSALGKQIAKIGGNPNTVETLSTIFGPVAGLIAALTGGPGGANHRTVYGFNATGGIGALQPQSDQPTAATEQAVQQISQNVQSFISSLAQTGINAQGILNGIQFDQITRSRLYYNTGPGAGAAGVQTTSNDPNDILSDIEKYLLQNATYADANEKALIDQMVAANDTLTQIETAITGYTQAQKDFKSITEGLLQYTNPALYATQTLQDQQLARRQSIVQEIQAGYFTPDQIAQIAQDLPQLEQQEIQAALAGVATGASSAAHALSDFVTAQQNVITFVNGLMVGSLSPLSPVDQLNAAQSAYATQLAAAQGGNYDALTGITATAQTYLTQAQQVYGSGSAYSAIFNQVTSSLTDLGNATLGDTSQVDAINAASAALQAAIAAGSLQIVTAVNDNTATTAASSAGMTPAQLQALLTQLANGTEANVAAISGGFASLGSSLSLASATQVALTGGLAAAA